MTEKDTSTTTPSLLYPAKSALRNWRSNWIVLIVGLIITGAATLYMKSSVENIANLEFISDCNEIKNKISDRLDDHARILLSGAALFNASETVTREEWRIFNKVQKIEKQLPGIQGIGFSLLIPRSELPRHVQKIRGEGFPQYKLRPDSERTIYSSIIYLEPFSDRNLRAFGYDMLSEPVRRAAMERARDTDTPALSGKVVLVQETDKEVQAGTLMYVPVYRKGMPIETVEQRRAAIYGWVYSPYRMNDLMQGIIGKRNLEEEKPVHLQVFDGTQPSPQNLLYECHPVSDKKLWPQERFTWQIPVDFNGHRWTLRFTQTGGGFSTMDYSSVWLTMVSGILITLLLFSLLRALLNTRAKAHIAENLAAELLASEEKYQSLFNNAQVALFRTRMSDGKLLEINKRYAQMAGYSNVNDCMAEFNAAAAWADPDGRKILVGILQENGFVTDYETSIIRRDGTHIWILFSATIFPEQGFLEGSIVDITERKQAAMEKEKVEAQNRQLQKSESLGRMAGAIAHHFNNQLGVVIGNLEMAMMALPKGAKPNENLTSAMAASNKAAEMSGLMLTYLGQSFDEREPLDISDACLRSLPLLQTVMSGNVLLETDLPSPGPVIRTNADYIQQVLTNLIINAREAIGDNKGTIHLNVKTVSSAEIPLRHRFPSDWQPQGNVYASMEVTDTGSGIEGKDMENIFDPFFTTKFTGRGMGMAVVLGIVRAHNGVIIVESKPKSGSTFRVFFPVSAEEVFRQPDKATLPVAIEGGGTVLLVEDDEMLRNMAASMLMRLGFSVIEAKDGVEAVDAFRQHKDEIRFALSDLTMPRMDGWEMLTALRKLQPGIPVILASGYDKAHVMSGDHPELPQVFLGKPYRLKELSDAISQALVSKKKIKRGL